jgi:hypothetical protein
MKAIPLLFAVLLGFAVQAAPMAIEAEYKVSRNGVHIGRILETYERDASTYRIESVTRTDGVLKLFYDDSVVLQSEGRFGAMGLIPLRFEQKRARDPGRDIRATFDWERAVMHSEYKGEKQDLPLPRGTQDRLSIMYQFMNVRPIGDEVKMHMSNGRKVELYRYRKVGEPVLSTPAGDFETLHFARVIENEGESKAEIWIAKDRFQLPLRAIFDDSGGARLEQSIVNLTTH